jgi:hypothetical protein
VSRIGNANHPASVTEVYQFFTDAIQADPGKWWAADLLPHMPLVAPTTECLNQP